MTQEELKAQAESYKADATDLLCREFRIPEEFHSYSIANIVDFIVSASVAETLAELEERKEAE